MYLVNMNNLNCLLVVVMFLFIHETLGEERTMIGTIIQDCTLNHTLSETELKDFRNQQHFSKCQNWTAISSISSQVKLEEEESVNYIRCLLYFETFVSFCKHLSLAALKNNSMIFEQTIPGNMDVKGICEGLSSKPMTKDHNQFISHIFKNNELCAHVCTEIKGEDLILNSLCAKSYYYNNITLKSSTSANDTNLKKNYRTTIVNKSNIQNNAIVNISNTNNLKETVIYPKQKTSPSSGKNETENDLKAQMIDENYITTGDNEIINTDSTNYLSQKVTQSVKATVNYLYEQKSKPNHNTYAASNKGLYNGGSSNKPEEQVITLPREPEEKFQHDELISNSFEVVKNDQFSETYNYDGDMEGNSYFFTYFTFICVAFIAGYVGYHNKQKILALLLEGRQTRRNQRDNRPNSANYHKLDSTLEEAISSSCNKNSSYVIY